LIGDDLVAFVEQRLAAKADENRGSAPVICRWAGDDNQSRRDG